jgi:hypothetical protein
MWRNLGAVLLIALYVCVVFVGVRLVWRAFHPRGPR